MTDHGRIEELLAVRALGGLDAAETQELDRALAAHGASCAECARLRSESEEVAGRLAFAEASSTPQVAHGLMRLDPPALARLLCAADIGAATSTEKVS